MKNEETENLYQLLRHHGEVLGITRTTVVALRALVKAISGLRCENGQFKALYDEYSRIIKNSNPRIIPLLNIIDEFEHELQRDSGLVPGALRDRAVGLLTRKLEQYELTAKRLTENAADSVEEEDVVVVHMASYIVTNTLLQAGKRLNNRFKVIILRQHLLRAKELIKALSEAGIEHIIIPSHDLGHYVEASNKLLVGAVTIAEDKKVMVAPGTANIVYACHLNNIDVYLLANTMHFCKNPSGDLQIYTQRQDIRLPDCVYCLTSHSHDLVDLGLFDHVITEQGEIQKECCGQLMNGHHLLFQDKAAG